MPFIFTLSLSLSFSLSLCVSVPLCLSQCLQHSTKSIRLMHSLATVSNGRCSRRGVQQQVTGTEQLVENVPFVGLKCRFERSFPKRTFPRIQTDLHCPLLRCKGITTVLCVSIPFLLFLGKCCPVSSPTT